MPEKLCYNRGCGKTYDPSDNSEDSCSYHTGAPIFHDAYKSWSCCGKKTTDFSTFLSTPGCSKGRHSNVKIEEPQTITGNKTKSQSPEVEEVIPEPIAKTLDRPSFDSEMIRIKPTIASSVNAQTYKSGPDVSQGNSTEIKDGESCKNGGCKVVYSTNINDQCVHHSGVPVFHEGLKFWSCCQRKTTDFQAFLNQEGCVVGSHKWIKDKEGKTEVECRYDWHQTGSHITIAIYAKKYDPMTSFIELNAVRMKAHLYFPEESGSYNMDIELKGIVSPEESSVSMLGTKIEIKLKKAEPGSWSRLDIVKTKTKTPVQKSITTETVESKVDALDLDDLELLPQKASLSKEASGGRTSAEII